MRLRIFLIPMVVVLVLVIAIGFIRPAVSDIEAKQVSLDVVSGQLDNVGTATSNIESFDAALNGRPDAEEFIARYLPMKMDQDRVMDALNFVASQSGVLLSRVRFEETGQTAVLHVSDEELSLMDQNAAEAVAEAEAAKDPVGDAYLVSADVRGSYENIKAFFGRISSMDRLHTVSSFSIKVDETLPGDTPDPAADLIGTFVSKFHYFSGRPVPSVVSAPIFQQGKPDFSPIESALAKASSPVTPLEQPQSGKPNPFR